MLIAPTTVLTQTCRRISDEVRAEELLNQFKSMLKPEEQQVEGSCGTFLRQLAALADRIEKGSTAGTNIN